MMSTKMATLGLLKIYVCWNKSCDVIISVHNVTNNILSHDSNYIVGMVMWPNFSNSSISMREVNITLILYELTRKSNFFKGWSWFKFNNLEVALGMALEFYTSVAKALKPEVRKFWGLITIFVEVTGEKLRFLQTTFMTMSKNKL